MKLRRAYESTSPDAITLRDWLALDRTVLANERTLLAYVRTALGLLAGGAALAHFLDSDVLHLVGWGLVVAAPVVAAVGIVRFVQVRRRLAAVSRPAPSVDA